MTLLTRAVMRSGRASEMPPSVILNAELLLISVALPLEVVVEATNGLRSSPPPPLL